jgi:hypothetical protein
MTAEDLFTVSVTAALADGDFNKDGTINAADYVAWRKIDGTQQGYDAWRTNFGELAGGGSPSTFPLEFTRRGGPSALGNTVPEPSAAMIGVICLPLLLRRRTPQSS